MEILSRQIEIPRVGALALAGLSFVFEQLKGGGWAELADHCKPTPAELPEQTYMGD